VARSRGDCTLRISENELVRATSPPSFIRTVSPVLQLAFDANKPHTSYPNTSIRRCLNGGRRVCATDCALCPEAGCGQTLSVSFRGHPDAMSLRLIASEPRQLPPQLRIEHVAVVIRSSPANARLEHDGFRLNRLNAVRARPRWPSQRPRELGFLRYRSATAQSVGAASPGADRLWQTSPGARSQRR
jgi:hypothetical protein